MSARIRALLILLAILALTVGAVVLAMSATPDTGVVHVVEP